MEERKKIYICIIIIALLLIVAGISKRLQYLTTLQMPNVSNETGAPVLLDEYDVYALVGDYNISETQSVYVYLNSATVKGRGYTVTKENAPKLFQELKEMMLSDELLFRETTAIYEDDAYNFSLKYTDSRGQNVTFYSIQKNTVEVNDSFYQLSKEVDVTSINAGIRAGFGDWGAVRDLE